MKKKEKVYETIDSTDEVINEVVLINGVKFKGKRISGKYFTLTDETKEYNAKMKKKQDTLNANYLIEFGKHKGKMMKDMISKDEYDYCVWFYELLKNQLSTSAKKKHMTYKAFSWAIRNNKGK